MGPLNMATADSMKSLVMLTQKFMLQEGPEITKRLDITTLTSAEEHQTESIQGKLLSSAAHIAACK